MVIQLGPAAWTSSIDTQNRHVAWIHGHAAWIHGHAAWTCSIGMQNIHEKYTCMIDKHYDRQPGSIFMKMHHRHAKTWTCSTVIDMQLGHGHAVQPWTCRLIMKMQHRHGHEASK